MRRQYRRSPAGKADLSVVNCILPFIACTNSLPQSVVPAGIVGQIVLGKAIGDIWRTRQDSNL